MASLFQRLTKAIFKNARINPKNFHNGGTVKDQNVIQQSGIKYNTIIDKTPNSYTFRKDRKQKDIKLTRRLENSIITIQLRQLLWHTVNLNKLEEGEIRK